MYPARINVHSCVNMNAAVIEASLERELFRPFLHPSSELCNEFDKKKMETGDVLFKRPSLYDKRSV